MITYLLGAGASASALPQVKEIPDRIDEIVKILKSSEYRLPDEEFYQRSKNQSFYQDNLITDMEWLRDESKQHASVDTLAKKLYLKKDIRLLDRLKVTLSIFLTICEQWKIPDMRYDSFIASICKEELSLPHFVRVLSWNYDTQFERSYSNFTDDFEINHLLNKINVTIKGSEIRKSTSEFSIYKLNGISLVKDNYKNTFLGFTGKISPGLNKEIIAEIVRSYSFLNSSNYKAGISFAWENDTSYISSICEDIRKTKILVVIGYSFPFFNREVDRRILLEMTNLQKVYYQTRDSENISLDRLNAVFQNRLDKSKFVVNNDCSQFYLPPEL